MNSGIYKILCSKSGKFYIGSSQELTRRKIHHYNRLRANKHGNPHLQNSFNLYGESNIIFNVLEYCSVSELLIREQFYIDQNKGMGILFNVAEIAGASMRNKRHAKNTIKKMKDSHKKFWLGKTLSDEHKAKISEKRMQYTRERGLRKLSDEQVLEVRKHSSLGYGIRTIARMLNIPRQTVDRIVKGIMYKDVVLDETTGF
jgi:group I intron endonuclease